MPADLDFRRRPRRRGRGIGRTLFRIAGMTILSLVLVRALSSFALGGTAESAQANPLTNHIETAGWVPPDDRPDDAVKLQHFDSATSRLPDRMEVGGTDGKGLRIRRAAELRAPTVGAVDEGALLQIVEGPAVDGDGDVWFRVATYGPTAITGWANAAFLRIAGSTTSVAPVPVSISAKLTGYTYQQPVGGAHGWITRSGTVVRPGVVAVDPRVIPLGTRLLIEGFDRVYVAEDTGFGVIGPHLDLFFPDEEAALRFGVQYGQVTVLN